MSQHEETNTRLSDPGRNWRDPPPPPPKKKPWWSVYSGTIALFAFMSLFIGYNRWFELSNPPPKFEELESQQIQVLHWYHLHPQLHVRLANGRNRMVEFPTFALLSRDMYHVISFEQQRQLVGKTCQMWGRPLRADFEDHYQVFALDCGDGTGLKFEQAVADYVASFNIRNTSTLWLGFFFTLFGCSLCLWAETVRHRKSLLKGNPS